MTRGTFANIRLRNYIVPGTDTLTVLCRIGTAIVLEYFRHGGILNYILRKIVAQQEAGSERVD